ncbi:RNA-directed DNA polymerase, eukaryota, partial [Tanacetum coccineum]
MIGRGRDTKTTEVARHMGVDGLGEDKKGVSKAHKEYYKEGDGNNRIFMFRVGKSKEEASRWVGSDGSKGVVCAEHQYLSSSLEAIGNERFTAVKGEWKGKVEEIFLVCIYGTHVSQQKASLWDRLAGLMDRMKGVWCIFRDLNVVRRNKDRLNSQVKFNEMIEINDFINDTRLVEILIGRQKFTRVSDDGMKFSKLDRFLLNEEFNNLWGNLLVTTLDRKLFDHCPMVL